MISSLSDAELTCIDQNPERMIATLIGGPGDPPASVEETAKLIGCLDDDTVNHFFIAAIVPGPGPLSAETTDCVLAGLDVIEPRALMTAGLVENEPERVFFVSLAAFNVSIACLTDEEWEKADPASEISDLGRAGAQCLMAELGGPGKYAEALLKTQEGDITDLIQAGAECRVAISVPWQPPATPTPIPTPSQSGITTPTTLVITVAGIPEYDWGEWKRWTDEDGDCQDARQEVLIEESLVEVTFDTDPNADTSRHRRAHSGTHHHRYGNAADHGHTYTNPAAGATVSTVAGHHPGARKPLLGIRPRRLPLLAIRRTPHRRRPGRHLRPLHRHLVRQHQGYGHRAHRRPLRGPRQRTLCRRPRHQGRVRIRPPEPHPGLSQRQQASEGGQGRHRVAPRPE